MERVLMNASNNLVIYMSGLCNLRCSYCYVKDTVFEKPIEKKVLLRAVSKFLNSPGKSKKITFLGGEPFLHFNLIKAVIIFIRKETKNNLPVHIFTNGLLIDEKISKFIKDFNINLIVSLNERDMSVGIFKARRDIKKIFKYIELGKTTVSLVIKKEAANDLFNHVSSLYKLGFRHIAWSPDITKIWNEKEILALKREMLRLRRHYLQLIKKGLELYEIANAYEIMDKILKRPFIDACMSVILCSDGNFIPCDKLIASDKNGVEKYASSQVAGGKKKNLFFKEALKYGADVKNLMCPVGAFAYSKYVLKSGASEVKRAVKQHIKLSAVIEENYFLLFKQALKYSAFRKAYNIND